MAQISIPYGPRGDLLRLTRRADLVAFRSTDRKPLARQLERFIGEPSAGRVGGWRLVRSAAPRSELLEQLETLGPRDPNAPNAPNGPGSTPTPSATGPRVPRIVARPVYQTSDADPAPVIPTGQLLVRFRDSATAGEVKQATVKLRQLGAVTTAPWRRDSRTFVVELGDTDDAVEFAVTVLREVGRRLVEFAEPNLAVGLRTGTRAGSRPTDPQFAMQWHLENDGAGGGVAGADARVVEAWKVLAGNNGGAWGDPNVIVASIDTGYDLAHPDLAPATIGATYDYASPDELDELVAREVHGTGVSALAVAPAGGGPVVGVAPGCSLAPIAFGSVLDAELVERWFDAAARSGARVVNCSWSAAADHWPLSNREWLAISACANSGPQGVVICFCAGNDNRDIDEPGVYVNGFALHPEVIAVGGSGCDDLKTPGSNHGSAVKLCAPSANTLRQIVTAAPLAHGGVNAYFGGTSASCPIVAGVAALVISVNPALTAQEVRDLLLSTARSLPGTPFGAGCVDAAAAVRAALALVGT